VRDRGYAGKLYERKVREIIPRKPKITKLMYGNLYLYFEKLCEHYDISPELLDFYGTVDIRTDYETAKRAVESLFEDLAKERIEEQAIEKAEVMPEEQLREYISSLISEEMEAWRRLHEKAEAVPPVGVEVPTEVTVGPLTEEEFTGLLRTIERTESSAGLERLKRWAEEKVVPLMTEEQRMKYETVLRAQEEYIREVEKVAAVEFTKGERVVSEVTGLSGVVKDISRGRYLVVWDVGGWDWVFGGTLRRA